MNCDYCSELGTDNDANKSNIETISDSDANEYNTLGKHGKHVT